MVDLVKERRSVADNKDKNKDKNSVPTSSPKETVLENGPRQHVPPQLNDEIADELVQHFKLLADETRLRILFFLMHQKELNVRSLCDLLEQSQPAVSHHLALLRNAKLIDSRRDGKHNFYHLMPAKFQQLIDTLATAAPGVPASVRFNDYVNIPTEA